MSARVVRFVFIVFTIFALTHAAGCGVVVKTVGKGVKASVKDSKKGKPTVVVKRGKKVVRCTPAVHKPHESHGSPGWIDAKATIVCTGSGTVRSASATILIQKKVGKRWKTVPGTKNTSTTATLKMKKKFTVMTGDLRCAPGTYRARAKANATVTGAKLIMKKGWMTSVTETDPC